MQLQCVNNLYMIDSDHIEDYGGRDQIAPLTIGKVYTGQILHGKFYSPGDEVSYGLKKQVIFYCFNDIGEWETYNVRQYFAPKGAEFVLECQATWPPKKVKKGKKNGKRIIS